VSKFLDADYELSALGLSVERCESTGGRVFIVARRVPITRSEGSTVESAERV